MTYDVTSTIAYQEIQNHSVFILILGVPFSFIPPPESALVIYHAWEKMTCVYGTVGYGFIVSCLPSLMVLPDLSPASDINDVLKWLISGLMSLVQ